jgi:hypothetical protein
LNWIADFFNRAQLRQLSICAYSTDDLPIRQQSPTKKENAGSVCSGRSSRAASHCNEVERGSKTGEEPKVCEAVGFWIKELIAGENMPIRTNAFAPIAGRGSRCPSAHRSKPLLNPQTVGFP